MCLNNWVRRLMSIQVFCIDNVCLTIYTTIDLLLSLLFFVVNIIYYYFMLHRRARHREELKHFLVFIISHADRRCNNEKRETQFLLFVHFVVFCVAAESLSCNDQTACL
jgi:uncharacterized membrane protein